MSTYGSNFINALRPAKYEYVSELGIPGVHFGVMAQDIDNYLTSQSDEDFQIIQYDENNNMMVDYHQLIGPMIKAIQELTERVNTLETQLTETKEK